jgi:murein L,D-transpeptidase YcbB/YkuD
VIAAAAVNWSDAKAVKPLLFRQKPGPVNALGHVKFLFPNPYDIYLHDTPSEGLFASEGRAFSHGCVRLEHPMALAKYLLRNRPEWTDEKIAAAMDRETEQPVPLTEGIGHVIDPNAASSGRELSARILPRPK